MPVLKSTDPPDNFWHLDLQDVFKSLTSSEIGLTSEEANDRLRKFGLNSFQKNSRSSTFILFLSQFKNPITLLLISAAIVSMGVKDITDSVIILVIIAVSSFLGYWQEKGAADSVRELLKLVQIRCRIVRDGSAKEMPIETAVPGDVITLSAGDMVPGDCLLLSSKELFIDEAAFTGETFPVEKNAGVLPSDVPLSKRSNTLFMGSHVISGRATAIIIKTANKTEFGKISESLRSKAPETAFEKGIRHFGYMLMEITLVLVILIFVINILLHKPLLDSFLFSLALTVGLTPQLLPAIISVNLAVGAKALARQQVIVKRLSAIENFGSMNILCSDKTGTITEGKVHLQDTIDVDGVHSDKVLRMAWLNASLQQGFANPIDEAIRTSLSENLAGYVVQAEVPYDFIRKRLTIQIKDQNNNLIITKGSFNSMVEICSTLETTTGAQKSFMENLPTLQQRYAELSNKGYRVLGLAYKNGDASKDITREDEHDMIFLGFISLFDPPRKDAKETVASLNNLGVQLKIITGDNALVALNLAREIGISNPVILTGPELREMSDRALVQQATRTDIFAEVEPNQKERIIVFLKKSGNVVGFIGDGINDAPALHAADVGISVDSAVDVAKEAADIVLLNQNLIVLINGIISGRKTFANTMKYIFMATSANLGNMFSMAGASLFLSFLPMLPKQILLTNLLTDVPEMTIATDNVDPSAVNKPHRWDIHFIQRFMIVFGLLSSVFDYLTFCVLLFFLKSDVRTFQTGWFVESIISAILIVLVIRTRLPFFKSAPGKYLLIVTGIVGVAVFLIPLTPLSDLMGFVRLPIAFYGWMMLIVSSYFISAEFVKRWFYKRLQNQK